MNRTSRVSVVLSTFDGSRHLPAQLASLARQTALPSELIVRDDGSTDGTVAILQRFAAEAPFPVRLTVGANVGLAASRAEVLPRCQGELVALCDQDDDWLPTKLARMAEALDSRPGSSAAVSDGWLVGDDGRHRPGTTFAALGFTPRWVEEFSVDPIRVLAFRSVVTGHALVVRRSVIDAAIPFPAPLLAPDAASYPDRWLSLVAAGLGPIAVIGEPLVRHRQHDSQQTGIDARPPVLAARAARRAVQQLVVAGDGTRARLAERSDLLREASRRTGSSPLETAADHLERRSQLPEQRLARLRPVMSEAVRGRYRWSGGGTVAFADALRPLH